jgi:hypothetical protein
MISHAANKRSIVPPQKAGTRKDIEHIIMAADENDARKLFMIARNRLVDVNHWHEYSGSLSATFQLTDQYGKEVTRTAEKGDYFKINIPAPGSSEGHGFDWVSIEAIEDIGNPDGDIERIALRVRPASNPKEKGENVAHFFSEDSTSSFILERLGNQVKAAVYGRNETPNTSTSNLIDKVRNIVVGVTAILGFSNVQWKNLVKGLITT